MKIETMLELIGIARRQFEETEQIGDEIPRSAWEDLWAARRWAKQARKAQSPTWAAAYLGAAVERLQRLDGLYRV